MVHRIEAYLTENPRASKRQIMRGLNIGAATLEAAIKARGIKLIAVKPTWCRGFEIKSRVNRKTLVLSYAAIGAVLGLVCSWLAGYDFDHRGAPAVLTLEISIILAGIGAAIAFVTTTK